MGLTPDLSAQKEDLADLRIRSLERIVFLVAPVGYVWLTLLAWPVTRGNARPATWTGMTVLLASATASYTFRHRWPHLASAVLVAGSMGAVSGALLGLRLPDLAYLFMLPVLFASILLSQRASFLVATLSILLTAGIGRASLGLPLWSHTLGLPMGILGLSALASWQAAQKLYTALEWAWSGYDEAHRNERIAREQQAELRRALKALDEATYRLERANHMLSLARDQAEEAHRLKQQFAQTISHELRTPLNLIVGFTTLMAESGEYYGVPLPQPYVRDLSIVHRNACHLQSLVNDVLDLARIEAAQMSLLPEETDPATLAHEAVNTVRSLVESRGLALRTEIEADLPRLWLDPTRIRQVLFNLLNNAARFTERGSITVRASREGEEVVFSVADTGVGIAPDDIPRIFEEFQQLDGGKRRRHDGAGLGLAISRRFVELHDGRIWVESRVGQGSTFYFSLAIMHRAPHPDPWRRPAEEPRPARPPSDEERILLAVTRSPMAATLLSRYLRGCRTVVLQDMVQAQRAAARLLPQGVFIDTAHQQLSPHALQELTQEWALPRTPFVACPLPGEEPLDERLNVDGYLIKPVSRQSLWDVLRRLGEDVDKVLVVDDDRDFASLMERLLESPVRRYQVAGAYSAREGLEMIQHDPPDLVLLDLMLPDMDGLQVIDRIRANPAWRHLPIVIVSAQDEIDTVGTLRGQMLITKAGGLLPGEIIRWTQHVLDTTARSTEPGLTAGQRTVSL